jgi:hypothetical protein
MEAAIWLQTWDKPGGARFRIGRHGTDLVADWEGLATLRVSRVRHELTIAPNVSVADADKLRNGPARALLRHLQGGVTLHGSSVEIGGSAIAFLGPSGSGKSTAAAHACAHLGARLLADDLVAIDVGDGAAYVSSSEAAHWLLPDSRSALGFLLGDTEAKVPVAARPERRQSGVSAPLKALITLEFDDEAEPSTEPIVGTDAFEALNAGYVRFAIDDPVIALGDLDQIARLSAQVPVFRLVRPRSFDRLEALARVLLDTLRELGVQASGSRDAEDPPAGINRCP